jgi:8-oxo-dGTP diphosphatase
VAHGEIAEYVPYGLFEPVQEYLDGTLDQSKETR